MIEQNKKNNNFLYLLKYNTNVKREHFGQILF